MLSVSLRFAENPTEAWTARWWTFPVFFYWIYARVDRCTGRRCWTIDDRCGTSCNKISWYQERRCPLVRSSWVRHAMRSIHPIHGRGARLSSRSPGGYAARLSPYTKLVSLLCKRESDICGWPDGYLGHHSATRVRWHWVPVASFISIARAVLLERLSEQC